MLPAMGEAKNNTRVLVRVIILSALGLVLSAGAWVYGKGRMNASREEAVADIRREMEELDAYHHDKGYFNQLLEHCAGKSSGGGIAYEKRVLACMVERLKADGKEGHTRLNALAATLDHRAEESN